MSAIHQLFGWAGPAAAQDAWNKIGHTFTPFAITGPFAAPDRACLFEVMKKLTGGYLECVRQEIGDCVSWGCRNAVDHSAICEIANGDRETFRPSFAPYFYGISRVQIGGGRLGNSDGSLGSWAADGVKQYGVLPRDAAGVPAYNGRVAKDWGSKGPPKEFVDLGKPHVFQEAARISTIEAARDALANGYGLSIASMWGANMRLKDDGGKSWFTGSDSWPHQMSILGYDTVGGELCFFRMNSWGPEAHGPQLDGPSGGGWIRGSNLARELRDNGCECFAFSGFAGFPAKQIDWSIF